MDDDDEPPGATAAPRQAAVQGTPVPADEVLKAAGWVRASRRERQYDSTPRVGQYFWVDFPHDAYHPEFVEEHPCIVIRAARRLHDTCIIVPVTSRPQDDARHAVQLAANPNPQGRKDGIVAWAVCDHLYTVSINRLRPLRDRYGRAVYPKVTHADLQAVFAGIRAALHHVFAAALPSGYDQSTVAAPSRPTGPNTLTLPAKR